MEPMVVSISTVRRCVADDLESVMQGIGGDCIVQEDNLSNVDMGACSDQDLDYLEPVADIDYPQNSDWCSDSDEDVEPASLKEKLCSWAFTFIFFHEYFYVF